MPLLAPACGYRLYLQVPPAACMLEGDDGAVGLHAEGPGAYPAFRDHAVPPELQLPAAVVRPACAPCPAHAPHDRIPRDGGRARVCGDIRCMLVGCLCGEPDELRLQPRRDPCRGREPHEGVERGIHVACTVHAAPVPEADIAEPHRDHAGADVVDMHPFRQAGAELPVHLLEGLRIGSGCRLHDRGLHIPLHLPGGIPILRMGSEASQRIEHDRADGSCQPLQ